MQIHWRKTAVLIKQRVNQHPSNGRVHPAIKAAGHPANILVIDEAGTLLGSMERSRQVRQMTGIVLNKRNLQPRICRACTQS